MIYFYFFRRSEFLGCLSFPVHTLQQKDVSGSFQLQPQSCLTNPLPPVILEEPNETEIIGIPNEMQLQSAAYELSQKALQQRDADENLFLRFLEFDQVPSDFVSHAGGRTPFTLSKQLQRHSTQGYGFSIVWTHPPRIEKVEPGHAADQAGIVPGDFVIFVGEQNVVTMPEGDVLNLIRSQGEQLHLEVFRRSAQDIQNFGVATKPVPDVKRRQPEDHCEDRQQHSKRPRVAFKEDVGCGIIV